MTELVRNGPALVREAMRKQTRTLLIWIVVANGALGIAVFAVAKLA
jgi:hypothetical protein